MFIPLMFIGLGIFAFGFVAGVWATHHWEDE